MNKQEIAKIRVGEETIPLYCSDCKVDLCLDIQLVERGDYPVSLAKATSVTGTLIWASTHIVRCGACFIKFQQTKSGAKMQNLKALVESETPVSKARRALK